MFQRLGVTGIAHVASVRDMHVTPDVLIRTTVAGTLSCLQAAAKEPSVKRFVLTSSSAAVRSLQAYRGTDTVSADEYDEQTLALSKNIPDTLPGLPVYREDPAPDFGRRCRLYQTRPALYVIFALCLCNSTDG